MDTKERHIRENESKERHEERIAKENHIDNSDLIANGLKANGKKRKNESTSRINKLWLWFGVLILILLLFWWLWTLGIFGDVTGAFNG